MIQPIQYGLWGEQRMPIRHGGPVDHDNGHIQRTGSGNLGIGPGAPRILGNDQVNLVGPHQGQIIFDAERTPVNDHMGVRQRQRRLWRVDQPQQVKMLRIGRKLCQMHPAHGQHHPLRRAVQGRNGARDIRHMGPAVAGFCDPRRPRQSHQRNIRHLACLDRVHGHLNGERVRGVDHMGDVVDADVFGQPLWPAKPPNALGQGLADRAIHAPSERNRSRQATVMDQTAKGGGFGRASQNQQVMCHV